MSVSLSEILAGAAARAVPLTGECAGYLVLAAADQVASSPRRVEPRDVRLSDDGAVRISGGAPADDGTAEHDLRELLDGLLAWSSSASSGLLRARSRISGAGVGALLRELETALIPVNRSAARRALARLARETERAKDAGRFDAAAPVAPAGARPPGPAKRSAPSEPAVSDVAPDVMSPELVAVAMAPVAAVSPAAPPIEATIPLPTPRPRTTASERETRPEPVISRASQRPPAPPAPAPRTSTPVLGTRVGTKHEVDEALAVAREIDIDVSFAPEERTLDPDDAELIVLEGEDLVAAEAHDLTERCPPIEPDSARPPAVVLVASPPPPATASEAVPAGAERSVPPEPEHEVAVVTAAADEPDSSVPPWVNTAPPEPSPRPATFVPVPRPRVSNVEDLLARLEREPVELDELRAGLKIIAGMDPTPAPPGTRRPG